MMNNYAKFDATRKYRYLLGRRWNANLPQVTFVMLNPSTADAQKDDHTLTRCIKFAKSWDYGSLEVVNLFAYVATNRDELKNADDPVGSENDSYIQSAVNRAKKIILAWGAGKYPGIKNRDKEVLGLISGKQPLHCLVLTKYGYPHHPLRLSADLKPIIFPNYS